MEKTIQSSWKYMRRSVDNFWQKESIGLFLGRGEPGRHGSAIVFSHAIFPFEKIGDGLRLDADFHSPEAGEEQVHLVTKAAGGTKIHCGTMGHENFPAPQLKQSPAGG